MFINNLNQLYKPERMLYYTEVSREEAEDFYHGKLPERIAKYTYAFGAYDYPGFFYIKSLELPVLGIELRADDPRIDYPTELSSMKLPASFFYSVEIEEEMAVHREFIRELFEKIAADDDAHRAYSDLAMKKDPEVISVFVGGRKIRILHEWEVTEDRTDHIIKDDEEYFDKKYLYKSAFTDFITGYYTWGHLVAFLEMPMHAGIKDYAFVHFDIKEFRVINEVYGHIAANRALTRVVEAMDGADFVYAGARCHNDNFAMLVRDMPEAELKRTLEEFFEQLSHLPEDPNYRIYYRCGVVPMQRSMLSGNRVADAGKMAQALGTSRHATDVVIYTDEMHNKISWGNYIKGYLDTAIENDEFVVFLQPKFDIHKEKIKGAEALIRWNYKKKEFLPPYHFIPYFEKDGSIGMIDDVVLHKVCAGLERWKQEGKPLYPISVNLSRDRLYDPGLVEHLTQIVDTYHVDHGLIDFELTESAAYDDFDHMIRVLDELREKGFKISMDDFGTGYSSLSLLTRMPLDTLKIDKSFVDPVATEEERREDITILRHIITLARELGFVCLAEGAEEKSQVDRLRELGCEVIQGYYYSKPIPMTEYEEKYL